MSVILSGLKFNIEDFRNYSIERNLVGISPASIPIYKKVGYMRYNRWNDVKRPLITRVRYNYKSSNYYDIEDTSAIEYTEDWGVQFTPPLQNGVEITGDYLQKWNVNNGGGIALNSLTAPENPELSVISPNWNESKTSAVATIEEIIERQYIIVSLDYSSRDAGSTEIFNFNQITPLVWTVGDGTIKRGTAAYGVNTNTSAPFYRRQFYTIQETRLFYNSTTQEAYFNRKTAAQTTYYIQVAF